MTYEEGREEGKREMTWSFSLVFNLGAVITIAVDSIIVALVYGVFKKAKKGSAK
jgi:hypothetical protein